MIHYIGKLIQVRPHEVGVSSLLFFYLFVIIGAYLMGQAVGDALFLASYSKYLPHAMILSAVIIGALVGIYIRISTRLHLQWLIPASLLFFSLLFCAFWWLTRFQLHWIYWIVYVAVYAFGAMGPMMGWTLANMVLTTRQARRVFGFIGAGAILGGTFSGFVTSDLLRRSHFRPQNMLLGIALLLAICALLVRLLFRSRAHGISLVDRTSASGSGVPQGFVQSVRVIRNSRYLFLITGLIAVGCVATCILGYQFKLIAKAAYGTNTAGLAAFFGRFNGYMGLACLLFQLVLTGPLLRIFGIRVTLFVFPAVLIGSSFAVFLFPTLLFGCILRGSHYILRYSLDKSSTELLYMPVAPEIRSQVKSFIDTFVWRTSDGIAGLTLLLFANLLKFNPGHISIVNIFMLTGWLVLAHGVRREYVNTLKQAIKRRTLDPGTTVAPVLDSTTAEVLAQALQRGDEQQLLYGLSLFEIGHHPGWHPALRTLLDHRSPVVRQAALRLLNDAGDRDILPRMKELLGDESAEVRTEALRYLVVHAHADPLTLLGEQSSLPPHVLQGAVIAFLAGSHASDYSSTADLILRNMLAQAGPEGTAGRREAARVLGLIPAPSRLHEHLHTLLQDEDPEVVQLALLSAGRSQVQCFLPEVIANLGKPRLVAAARTALTLYDSKAIEALQHQLNDPAVPISIRRQIPKTLARIHASEAVTALACSLVQSDPLLRHGILKALNRLRRHNPEFSLPTHVDYEDLLNAELMGYYRSFQTLAALDLPPDGSGGPANAGPDHVGSQLLRRAFQERMGEELERIFELMALIYPQRDISNAFWGLTSRQPHLRANALEVLENSLHPNLYRRLANVLDPEVTPQQRLDYARRFCRSEVGSRVEALRILLHSEDLWIRCCAVYMVGMHRLKEHLPDLERCAGNRDPLLLETLAWTQSRLSNESAVPSD
jgi:AAA family ATP:ADP antiporter